MIDIELVKAQYDAQEEVTRQKNIVLVREYYDGDQKVNLTKRMQEFLGFNQAQQRFAINYCATVINAVVERMIVRGFDNNRGD